MNFIGKTKYVLLQAINRSILLKLISMLLIISFCAHGASEITSKETEMDVYPLAFVHGRLQEVFPDIFFVTGAVYVNIRETSFKKAITW